MLNLKSKKLALGLGLLAAGASAPAFAVDTVTVPTIVFPTGFDVPALLTTTVANNGTFILGGVAVVAMLFIIAKVAGGLRRGAGHVAKGGH